jgi:signal transduction histidine kinase
MQKSNSKFFPDGIRWKVFVLVAALSLFLIALSGGVQTWMTQRSLQDAMRRLQNAQLNATTRTISDFLKQIDNQTRESINKPWGNRAFSVADRQEELHRLIKINPAIDSIQVMDIHNRETLFVSRTDQDRVASGITVQIDSQLPSKAVLETVFITQRLEGQSAPALTMVFYDAQRRLAAIASINLRLVSDLISELTFGQTGRAWVVGADDQIIAHPNLSLVLKPTKLVASADISRISRALANSSDSATQLGIKTSAPDKDGAAVYLSAKTIAGPNWTVFVEQSEDEIQAPLKQALSNILYVSGVAVLIAFWASLWLSNRVTKPIQALQRGAQKLGEGDLSVRMNLDTGDEVQALANQFNQMAQQLQSYTNNLEQMVSEKTDELQRANQELAAASRHKTEFLAHVSHELRTPLNAVIGFSDALKQQMFGPLNDKQVEYIGDIRSSGLHLLSLINTILDLSKIEAGKTELELSIVDVRYAVNDAITLVKERAYQGGITLNLEVSDTVDQWPLDERKFKQILVNLLTNAVKFTLMGGQVRLQADVQNDCLQILISDTGIGISQEDQPRLFVEFTQVGADYHRRAEGTGLGLSLVKRLTELHGGTVTVKSELGIGSTFILKFFKSKVQTPILDSQTL